MSDKKPTRYAWLNNSWVLNNGGGKVVRDFHLILKANGWQSYETIRSGGKVQRIVQFIGNIINLYKTPRDSLFFVQLPQHGLSGKFMLRLIIHRFKTVAALNDLDRLRNMPSLDEDVAAKSDYLINSGRLSDYLPNPHRKQKIASLQMWDYLLDPETPTVQCDKSAPVLFAGNLKPDKVPALYLPSDRQPFVLYGMPYEQEKAKVADIYMGPFEANMPVFEKTVSFGLLWENQNSYEKINIPHKFSLYLACGIPVLVWKEAYIAKFIEENKCGVCISSLDDIERAKNSVSDAEYADMRAKAMEIGRTIRSGGFLKLALQELGL